MSGLMLKTNKMVDQDNNSEVVETLKRKKNIIEKKEENADSNVVGWRRR
jgi:hypothetical protein